MKKFYFISVLMVMVIAVHAQNTFPSNGNVGIGTTSPGYLLDVYGDIHSTGEIISTSERALVLQGFGSGNFTLSALYSTPTFFKIDIGRLNNSHYATPLVFVMSGRGGETFIKRDGSTSDYIFNDNHDNTLLKITGTGNVGIGTINLQSKLAVNGTITAKKLIVTQNGWPDYVFDSTYTLMSLQDLEVYLRTHQHLPHIPSATEIQEKGLDIGKMQKQQMKKIEELTLYLLKQSQQIQKQQQQNTTATTTNEII